MAQWIISSSLLIAAVMLLRRVLRGRISLILQYALWLIVLIRLVIPFSFFESGRGIFELIQDTATEASTAMNTVIAYRDYTLPDLSIAEPDPYSSPAEQQAQYEQNVAEYEAEMQHRKEETGTPVTVEQILKVVWYSGMAITSVWFIIVNLHFSLRLRRSRARLNIDCVLKVYRSGTVITPCLSGLFCPAIYLTPEIAENEETLRHVTAHELTHYRHGDHIWAVLRCACIVLHWYNPLVWAAAELSRRDCELACDEGAVKSIGEGERAAYGKTLINLTCQRRGGVAIAATTMTGGKKSVKERIALLAKRPKTTAVTLGVVIIAAAALAAVAFTTSEDSSGINPMETPYENKTENDLNEISDHISPAAFSGGEIVNYCPPSELVPSGVWQGPVNYPDATVQRAADILSSGSLVAYTEYEWTARVNAESSEYATMVRLFFDSEYCISFTVDELGVYVSIATDGNINRMIYYHAFDIETENAIKLLVTEEKDGQSASALFQGLYSEYDSSKLCIAVMPTGISKAGGDYRFLIPLEQEKWITAYNKAAGAMSTERAVLSGGEYCGYYVVYNDHWLFFSAEGALYEIGGGCADIQSSAELYELCQNEIKNAGLGEPVRPADIKHIVSATLQWNGEHTITDESSLTKIGKWLSESSQIIGGAACPYTALLTLELEGGEKLTVAMATDSCSTWLSEGVYYEYAAADNAEFFTLFAAKAMNEAPRELTLAELSYFREFLAPIVTNENGISHLSYTSCFLTSYYADIKDINYEEFIRYFAGSEELEPDTASAEYRALSKHPLWFWDEETTSSGHLPVPIRRYPAAAVNAVLLEYAGIDIDDLNGIGLDNVIYLPEYDAYYNFTSDAGYGTFNVSHGHKSGSTVWLYEEGSGDELVLNYENGRYVFVSHLPGE